LSFELASIEKLISSVTLASESFELASIEKLISSVTLASELMFGIFSQIGLISKVGHNVSWFGHHKQECFCFVARNVSAPCPPQLSPFYNMKLNLVALYYIYIWFCCFVEGTAC